MTAGLTQALFLGAALFGAGLLAVLRRRDFAAALAGVPVMLAGAALDAAAATRFAAGTRIDPVAGQELAVLLGFAALGFAALGLGLIREGAR